MKLGKYIKDKLFSLFLFLFMYSIFLLMLIAFKSPVPLIKGITVVYFFFSIVILLINYSRKKHFYQELLENIKNLDKAYLVLETISNPDFYEGRIFYQALYEVNKSMNEYVKTLEFQMNDFKEYIEMWIHEVKIPLSSILLMSHNQKMGESKKLKEQINRMEDYLEQVLYYIRSENVEKDYLIKEVELKGIIHRVALKNKDILLENHIDLIVENQAKKVVTDSKWFEFMLNQIMNNSIKYKDENKNSYIKIATLEKEEKIVVVIEDNGIGIPKKDLSRVFDKSFTGHNGRLRTKSTGMGLFIVKKLCKKLGHHLQIESVEKEYTKVFITLSKNHFYEVIK